MDRPLTLPARHALHQPVVALSPNRFSLAVDQQVVPGVFQPDEGLVGRGHAVVDHLGRLRRKLGITPPVEDEDRLLDLRQGPAHLMLEQVWYLLLSKYHFLMYAKAWHYLM